MSPSDRDDSRAREEARAEREQARRAREQARAEREAAAAAREATVAARAAAAAERASAGRRRPARADSDRPSGAAGERPVATPAVRRPLTPHELRFRRRRRTAGFGGGALVLLLVIAVSGGGGQSAVPRVSAGSTTDAASVFPLSRPSAQQAAATTTLGGVTPAQVAAIDRTLRYTSAITSGGTEKPEVALTIDDGPATLTPQFVATLQREHAPATFFVLGDSMRAFPTALTFELAASMPVEDHTLTHPFLGHLSPSDQEKEIVGDAQQIQANGAPYPRLFRPPYGSFDQATEQVARRQKMLMVLWSVDTRDFSRPGVDAIVQTALSGAGPGSIILMHDGGGPRDETLAALPRIISGLRRRGLRLVTVPQLMLDDPPPPGQTPPGSLAGG